MQARKIIELLKYEMKKEKKAAIQTAHKWKYTRNIDIFIRISRHEKGTKKKIDRKFIMDNGLKELEKTKMYCLKRQTLCTKN